MGTARESYGTGAAIDSLYSEVTQLCLRYGELLEQESLTGEVSVLRDLLEEYMRGSPEAASYLREHGEEVLKDVKRRLKAAVAQETRLIEESPSVAKRANGNKPHSASRANGNKPHSASRAVALTAKADRKIHTALNETHS